MSSAPALAYYLSWICAPTFLYGYHISMLNSLAGSMICSAPDHSEGLFFSSCVDMSPDGFSLLTGIYTIGGLIGSFFAGSFIERNGRRRAIVASPTLIGVGSLLMAISGTLSLLLLGRFLTGLGAGLATVVVPLILDRLGEANAASRVGIFNQLGITIGILSALGLAIPFGQAERHWRWVPACSGALAFVHVLLAPSMPRSIFATKAAEDQAAVSSSDAREQEELLSGREEEGPSGLPASAKKDDSRALGLSEVLTSSDATIRKGVYTVIVSQVLQQASGINAVMYYSTDIIGSVLPTGAVYISLMVAVANCVLTLAPIVLVAYTGRRKLLLLSASLCAFWTCALGVGVRNQSPFVSSVSVVAFVSSFSLGLGAIPMVLIPEVVPERAASAAGSIGFTTNWAVNGLIATGFARLSHFFESLLGTGGIFFAFSAITVVLTLTMSRLYQV